MTRARMAMIGFLLAATLGATEAFAEPPPDGTYAQTCRPVTVVHGALLAICHQADGTWDASTLANVNDCLGDIAHVNDRLVCNGLEFGSGSPRKRYGSGTGN